MQARHLILPALGALALLACDTQAPPAAAGPVALAPAGFDVPAAPGTGELLPVWQNGAERLGAKEDALDIRSHYADVYGFTAAPAGGARAVAEFEPTDGVLIAWQGGLQSYFLDLIRTVATVSDVYLMTPDMTTSGGLGDYLADQGIDTDRLHFFEYEHDAFWTRDFGPIAIELADGAPAFVDAQYYYHRRLDDAVPTLLSDHVDVEVVRPEVATEGGKLMTNGEGLCVVTEWLLQENPYVTDEQLANRQVDFFGCDRTIVLARMAGEGTGHVDMFAKFTARDTVLVGRYEVADAPQNAGILDWNAERLAEATLADGTPLKVVRIPMPTITGDVYRSYTNSLIVNGLAIVPSYDTDRHLEDAAVAAYREALPADYEVTLVDSSDIIQYGGAVHCTTMQFNHQAAAAPPEPPRAEPPVLETPTLAPATPDADSFSASPGAAIEDNKQAVDTFELTLDGDVTGLVEVKLALTHSYVGDLAIYLEHDGLWAELRRFAGGSSDNIDETYQVRGFEGSPRAGQWRLVVEDHATQDEGTFDAWTLTFL